MSAQTLTLEIKGIHTYNSDLSGVPQGALKVGRNINVSRLNIAEPRRGFDLLEYSLPSSTDRLKKIIFYDNVKFVQYGTTLALYDDDSGLSSVGTIEQPSAANSIRSVAISRNLLLTSSAGIKKIDDAASSMYQAGLPKATMLDLSLSGAAGTALEDTKYVTYRYLIARNDANKNLIRGGVSGRYTIQNTTGGTKNVVIRVYLPQGLGTSHFAQIYRSDNVSVEPGDEQQLCYEYPLESEDISAGYFDFTDIVTDDLLGANLYTSPSQEGIANDNAEPPLARDITEYKNHVFFGDVESKHRFSATLIACGGTEGLASADTITITRGVTAEVYTAGAAYNIGTKTFVVDTTSVSLALRIDNTIRSLVKLINQTSAIAYCYLQSTGEGDLPGKFLLEERSLGGAAFVLTASRATPFSPQIKSTPTVEQTSSNDAYRNGLMYSKDGQPEAVPLKNIFFVGSSDDRILRIKALRDGLFILKSDGVYVLRGEGATSFSVTPLDLTAKLVAPDSVVVVNNLIYGLFDAGVAEVSDSGVSFISTPIKDALLPLYGSMIEDTAEFTFGIGYQVEGKYILAVPEVLGAISATRLWVFDVFGRTWCDWDIPVTTGQVSPYDNKLYLGSGDSNKIKIERKAFDYTDYADFGNFCTATAYTGRTVSLSNTADMSVGDILTQGDLLAYIESVDVAAQTVVIDSEQDWALSVDTIEHYKGIAVKVEWNPDFAGNPAGFKQFYEANILFKNDFQRSASVFYYSDLNLSEASITINADSGNGAWGEFEWGESLWGGETGRPPRRIGIPRQYSRCNQLSVRFESNVAFSDFQLNGISLTFNPISTRGVR